MTTSTGARQEQAEQPGTYVLTLPTDVAAAAHARQWVDDCLVDGDVPHDHRSVVRRVGMELVREAALRAGRDATVSLELDVTWPIVRLSAAGHADTHRLGARAVDALESAFEWGIERLDTGERRVWCFIRTA